MRYASGHKEKTRARILEAAGKVFRRHGFHASGVDRVMEEAGLTAGGFYAHFDSKQALLAEALTHAGAQIGERREQGIEGLSGREWVDAFLARYLSTAHRRKIEDGCPLAALISEISRADESVKESFEALVRGLGAGLASHTQDSPDPGDERVLAAIALCVGGLGLARSVRDEAFAERILESCRNQAKEMLLGRERSPAPAKPRRKRKDS